MKCNKCGEECKDNQAFCLKCGNPIQVVPDFNLIEAELASNIGELMDEIDHENKNENESPKDTDEIKEVQINDMELKLVDISRHGQEDMNDGKTKVIGDISHMIKAEKSYQDEMLKDDEGSTDEVEQEEELKQNIGESNKKSKKKTAIIISVVAAILVLSVVVFIVVAKSVEKSATSYDEYYKEAKGAYEKMNTKDGLENAKMALDKASNNSEKLAARELIHDIYVLSGENGSDYADNLEGIIKLETKNVKYYTALAKYYDENEKYANLTELMRSVEDDSILEALSEYVVKEPAADFESGSYGSYMAVTLTADENYTIYYTTDSRNPSNYGEKYTEPIQIAKEGESVIKAVAVNDKGIESKIVTFTYDVTLSETNAPKVSPSGGAYTEYTKIKIEVSEGGKAYYTWDGTEPTEESQEYTEEIDMKRGINVLKVIVVDKYGIVSEVVQESYNLQIPRELSLNEAVALIEEEAAKSIEEGETVKASYENTAIIGNDEYYIICASINDADDKQKSVTMYGVNTFDKTIKIVVDEEGQYSIDEEDDEEATSAEE